MQVRRLLQIVFCIFILTVISGCGITLRSEIRGRVIDAETQKPIKGAVFAIKWYQCHGCCLGIAVGDYSGCKKMEAADGYTNADGSFSIPKYTDSFMPPTSCDFAVYKKGYAVWELHEIRRWGIYDEVRGNDKRFSEFRYPRDFTLKDGMVIKLEPWKEGYSAEGHSNYLYSLSFSLDSNLFTVVTREERNNKRRK